MEYLDIVKENDTYRVRLEREDYAEKPYDDGATPILSREHRYGRWEAVNSQAEEFTGLLNELYDRFEEDVIERFIRIFLGAYSVEWDSSSNCRYLAFDTTAWREHHGLTDEYMSGVDAIDPTKLAEGSLEEIIAWADGEVYGYILEKKKPWTKVYEDEDEDEAGFDWEVVESCWGFYGEKYAREEAESVFDAHQ